MKPKVGDLVRLQEPRKRYDAVDAMRYTAATIYDDQVGLLLEDDGVSCVALFNGKFVAAYTVVFEVAHESQSR